MDKTGAGLLTRADDDGGWLVVDGHGPVVGSDRQAAAHLVQAPVHHGSVHHGPLVRINFAGFFSDTFNIKRCT